MVTKVQYAEAWEIIISYYKQTFEMVPGFNTQPVTPVAQWIAKQPEISDRLCQILLSKSRYNNDKFIFIEDISHYSFKQHSSSRLAWEEFTRLRGY